MDHYTFMLEVSHDLKGIPLPSNYAKPIQKDGLALVPAVEYHRPIWKELLTALRLARNRCNRVGLQTSLQMMESK
jgi:hypothetical protein